ncbi:MAG: hypothetical protein FWD76_05205, partial [Firmicutes bacterium]|nr:hypothetical protein [Bacillota bacterium]
MQCASSYSYNKESKKVEESGQTDTSTQIFVKLRELNTIINNANIKQKKSKKPWCEKSQKKVTFLYAIADDVISDWEQRAKFFEFILPIPPILNTLTKTDLLFKQNKENVKIDNKLNLEEEFINVVAFFIPNMRVLKNTTNDYIISHQKLFENMGTRLKNENLFAMCLYKNLFSESYSRLEKNEGIVPEMMNKEKMVEQKIREIKESVQQLEEEGKQADKEQIESFMELKSILAGELNAISRSNGRYMSNSSPNKILFKDIATFQDLDFSLIQYGDNAHLTYAIEKDFKYLGGTQTYAQKELRVLNKSQEAKQKRADKIQDLQKQIIEIEQKTIGELLENVVPAHFERLQAILGGWQIDEDDANQKHNKGFKHQEYLQFWLEQGYIAEDFLEYTTPSKSSLSKEDDAFCKSVFQGVQSFDHKV